MKIICSTKRTAVISADGMVVMASFAKISISGEISTAITIRPRPKEMSVAADGRFYGHIGHARFLLTSAA